MGYTQPTNERHCQKPGSQHLRIDIWPLHTQAYITDVQIKGYECPFVTELISVLWLPLHAPTLQFSRNSKDCSQDAGQVCRVGTLSLVCARQEVAQTGVVLLISGVHKQVRRTHSI